MSRCNMTVFLQNNDTPAQDAADQYLPATSATQRMCVRASSRESRVPRGDPAPAKDTLAKALKA
jgi:hypothetical protein